VPFVLIRLEIGLITFCSVERSLSLIIMIYLGVSLAMNLVHHNLLQSITWVVIHMTASDSFAISQLAGQDKSKNSIKYLLEAL